MSVIMPPERTRAIRSGGPVFVEKENITAVGLTLYKDTPKNCPAKNHHRDFCAKMCPPDDCQKSSPRTMEWQKE